MYTMDRAFGRIAVPTLTLVLLPVLLSCRRADAPPETVVRTLVAEAEEAAEDNNIGVLRDLIAENYRDGENRTKTDLSNLVAYYFLRHRNIHLITLVRRAAAETPDRLRATVLVAMAGQPVEDIRMLSGLRADFYRFDILVRRDDGATWRVTSASWQRARRGDFFGHD